MLLIQDYYLFYQFISKQSGFRILASKNTFKVEPAIEPIHYNIQQEEEHVDSIEVEVTKKQVEQVEQVEQVKKLKKVKKLSYKHQSILTTDFMKHMVTTQELVLASVCANQEVGYIGIDSVDRISSHKFGIFSDSELLDIQMFFQVEFQPKQDGTIPRSCAITLGQARQYCISSLAEYILSNKEQFEDPDKYLY